MTPLDRRSPTPLWAQLAEDLEARLASGEFEERFPTDDELVRDYEVSRQTAREAVRRLSEAGMVERQRGRGSFVTRPSTLEQPIASFYSLAHSITERGLAERSEVLRFEPDHDSEATHQLRLGPRDATVLLERLRFAGDEPLAIDRSWLPATVMSGIGPDDLGAGSLYALLSARSGIRVTGGRERIRAVVPDANTRALLCLPRGEAALRVERLALSANRPVEWRVSTYRGDRFTFLAEWSGRPI